MGRAQAGTSIASSLVQLSLTCVAASKNAKMGTQVSGGLGGKVGIKRGDSPGGR